MKFNVGTIDRVLRIVAGLVLIALAATGTVGWWGWLAGRHWLGRCAALLQPLQQLAIDGVAPDALHRLTAAPRRYGWHATLKAPFALAS